MTSQGSGVATLDTRLPGGRLLNALDHAVRRTGSKLREMVLANAVARVLPTSTVRPDYPGKPPVKLPVNRMDRRSPRCHPVKARISAR